MCVDTQSAVARWGVSTHLAQTGEWREQWECQRGHGSRPHLPPFQHFPNHLTPGGGSTAERQPAALWRNLRYYKRLFVVISKNETCHHVVFTWATNCLLQILFLEAFELIGRLVCLWAAGLRRTKWADITTQCPRRGLRTNYHRAPIKYNRKEVNMKQYWYVLDS